MIEVSSDGTTFRGTEVEIEQLHRRLAAAVDSPAPAQLVGTDVDHAERVRAELVAAMGAAISSPVFALGLDVSGPGGLQTHSFVVGRDGIVVRRSPVRDGDVELSAFPMTLLPGAMTRVVRFLPGRPPAHDAPALGFAPQAVVDLTDPAPDVRRDAWDSVRPVLEGAGYPGSEDSSWQMVQSRATWTRTDGRTADEFSVHLRWESHYFVVVESATQVDLVPVPSITAWEAMVQVLPGPAEIARPA
ncbi:hypothetical protein [Brachybacterium paraconglomeratum]|uniref:hypothetical protein n=1 Tax=Brachybacterium paraconglomeratum TaxID=173362 RepID=UPI0021A8D711|nr:hypothetical protein [Brachybacterium paraconglomeratum]MCT1910278.1 hypothetical protein [Brachybacterium paraconglomeratum]